MFDVQVSNVTFTDLDLDLTELAGTVYWMPPVRTTAVTVPRPKELLFGQRL